MTLSRLELLSILFKKQQMALRVYLDFVINKFNNLSNMCLSTFYIILLLLYYINIIHCIKIKEIHIYNIIVKIILLKFSTLLGRGETK